MPAAPNSEIPIIQTGFSNGISSGMADKTWLPDSCLFSRNLAIFDNLNYVTVNPQPAKDSGSVVTDLVRWMDAAYPFENARYAYGDAGNVYKITSNTWTLDHTISSASQGNGMAQLGTNMCFATNTNIAVKQNINGTAAWTETLFGTGLAHPVNIDISVNASGNTYTAPSSITETGANSLTFGGLTTGYNTLAYDPVMSVALKVASVGTGDWTVTFHDSSNNVLGTKTIVNASMSTGNVEFAFATQIGILLGAPYHVHVTTTTGDGTVTTTTSGDLSTAWVQTFYGVLINNAYHEGITFQNGVSATAVFANDSYLAVWDGVTYNPNKIRLEPGFSVRKIVTINQNLVAYCTKGSDLTAYEEGRQYVWDGIQPYYTLRLPLKMGMPNTAVNFKNRLLGRFGLNGDFSIAPDETQPFRQIQQAPKLTKGSNVATYPGAIDVWQKRALFSYSGTSDANAGVYNDASAGAHVAGDTYTPPTGIEQGVYEFGNQSDREITYTAVSTEVLNFAYQPSTPIANTQNFWVGVIRAFGNDLYISYQDGTNFYVDRVNKANGPYTFGSWESLITDQTLTKYGQLINDPQKSKLGVRVRVTFVGLPAGCTVTAKYRTNRTVAWTFGVSAVAGDTSVVANMGTLASLRYKEVEYGFDITTPGTGTFPKITSVGMFYVPETAETTSGFSL